MPPISKPESLTKDQLKKELIKHGVKLPDQKALKSVYINLYKDKIANKVTSSGFSSEEDELPVIRITRSAIKQMESENGPIIEKCMVVMEKNIIVDGQNPTGFRRSPRKIKKPLRYIEISDGSQKEIDDAENKTDEEPQSRREVRVKVKRIDFTTARNMMMIGGVIFSELSDDQLRDELEARGISVGPVVDSTRKLYERKLEKLLKSAGTGDAKSADESHEYSDEEDDDEEEEIDVEETTPMQTRSRQPLLRSADREFSSAPNLTSLGFHDNRQKSKTPSPVLTRKPHPKLPSASATDSVVPAESPAWVNISLSDDMALIKNLPGKSPNRADDEETYFTGGFEYFQHGAHVDGVRRGGVRGAHSHESFLELGNQSSTTLNVEVTGDKSLSLSLDNDDSATFSPNENDLEDTLQNSDDMLNSTEIKRPSFPGTRTISQLERPLTSHLARDLLSPNLSKTAYTKRIQEICGSATRRRAMRTRDETLEELKEKAKQVDETPTPSSGENIIPEKSERRWIPVWAAIVVVVLIVAFFYLVIEAMESNPRKKIPHRQ